MNFKRTRLSSTQPSRFPVKLLILLLTLGLGAIVPNSFAPPIDNYHISEAKQLSEDEAVQYLVNMQRSAIARSYVFRFKLKHYPYRARSFTKYGTLYGVVDPLSGIQMERIVIQDRDPENPREYITLSDFLLIRSSRAEAWVHNPELAQATGATASELPATDSDTPSSDTAITASNPQVVELNDDALHTPVLEGISLSYFDLLVPYFYWREYEYMGPDQVKARPTQDFKLYNPDTASDMASVRLYLDDEFKAILKAEYLDADSEPLKTMELVSFKKTGGTYIPKTLDYRENIEKGNKTRIDIIAAATDVELPAELFSKSNLGQELPYIDTFVFDVF